MCYLVAFLAEAMIVLWYMGDLFTERRKISQIVVFTLGGYLLLYAVQLLNITVLNTISFFVVNCLLMFFCYDCAIKTSILHSAFLSFIMTIAEVLIALFMSLIVGDFAAYTHDFRVLVTMAILSKFLYLVFAFIGARIFAPHKKASEEPGMMVLFCSLPIFSMVISIIIVYIGLRTELTEATGIMMLVNVLALLVVNLIFLMLYNYIQKENTENLALQLRLQKGEADAEYYQTMQEQSENQRILIHDIKNHLHTIEGIAQRHSDQEISEYIAELESTLNTHTMSRLCSDPVLNLLLYRGKEECRAKDIDLQLDIRENGTAFMDAPSITTLYGNLLSNAIEAASVSREKIIELSVVRHQEQGLVMVSIVNSCDEAPLPNMTGGFRTRKQTGIHGVGLKSIARVVRKFHGMETTRYDSTEHKFHHVIQFPINT